MSLPLDVVLVGGAGRYIFVLVGGAGRCIFVLGHIMFETHLEAFFVLFIYYLPCCMFVVVVVLTLSTIF